MDAVTNKDAGPNRPPSRTTKGGKYLTFALGAQEYGLPLLRVREIMAMMDVTPVPLMPSYVRGVMNLRGKVIPVVDLRRKLGMTSTPDHDRKCIIVVDVERTAAEGGRPAGGPLQMSILVDAVSEVLFIGEDDIEAATARHSEAPIGVKRPTLRIFLTRLTDTHAWPSQTDRHTTATINTSPRHRDAADALH